MRVSHISDLKARKFGYRDRKALPDDVVSTGTFILVREPDILVSVVTQQEICLALARPVGIQCHNERQSTTLQLCMHL